MHQSGIRRETMEAMELLNTACSFADKVIRYAILGKGRWT